MRQTYSFEKTKNITLLFSNYATVGVICTGFSLGSNFLLLKYLDTPLILTYVGINVISIALSFFLNSHFTFQSKKNLRNASFYYMIYFSSMMLSVILLYIFENTFEFPKWIYPFMIIPFKMVWNFIFSFKFLGR